MIKVATVFVITSFPQVPIPVNIPSKETGNWVISRKKKTNDIKSQEQFADIDVHLRSSFIQTSSGGFITHGENFALALAICLL